MPLWWFLLPRACHIDLHFARVLHDSMFGSNVFLCILSLRITNVDVRWKYFAGAENFDIFENFIPTLLSYCHGFTNIFISREGPGTDACNQFWDFVIFNNPLKHQVKYYMVTLSATHEKSFYTWFHIPFYL